MTAYIDSFLTLLFIQLLALLFSLNGTGSFGTGNNVVHVSLDYYNADVFIMFTFVWGFVTGIVITTKPYRLGDYVYVANRTSSHVANWLYLLTASMFAGSTAILSGSLLKFAILMFSSKQLYVTSEMSASSELALGIVVTSMYVFLFCALGYTCGMIVQSNRLFVIVLPVLFIGDLFIHLENDTTSWIVSFFSLFFSEASLPIFIGKIAVVSLSLFFLSFLLSNRLEVR